MWSLAGAARQVEPGHASVHQRVNLGGVVPADGKVPHRNRPQPAQRFGQGGLLFDVDDPGEWAAGQHAHRDERRIGVKVGVQRLGHQIGTSQMDPAQYRPLPHVFSTRPRHVPLGHPPSIDDEIMRVRHPSNLTSG